MAMEPKISKNEKLDQIGTALLRSCALRDEEIEAVADGRRLFLSVKAKIAVEKAAESSGSLSVVRRPLLLSAAAAVVIIAVIGVSGLVYRAMRMDKSHAIVAAVDLHDAMAAPPSFIEPSSEFAPLPRGLQTRRFEKAVFRPERRAAIRQQPLPEEPLEFYALGDVSPSEEAIANGRVVRVDLPRASLVALGVNISLESDRQLIKTDLLVGPDGVPRAIRLVD